MLEQEIDKKTEIALKMLKGVNAYLKIKGIKITKKDNVYIYNYNKKELKIQVNYKTIYLFFEKDALLLAKIILKKLDALHLYNNKTIYNKIKNGSCKVLQDFLEQLFTSSEQTIKFNSLFLQQLQRKFGTDFVFAYKKGNEQAEKIAWGYILKILKEKDIIVKTLKDNKLLVKRYGEQAILTKQKIIEEAEQVGLTALPQFLIFKLK